MKKLFISVELFVGMGGAARGIHNTKKFKTVLAIDNDDHAEKCFRLNFPNVQFCNHSVSSKMTGKALLRYVLKHADPETREQIEKHGIDYFHASPPCQGNSVCGKRQVNDERNFLYHETIRIIGELRPAVFTIENVPGMTMGAEYKNSFNRLFGMIEAIGYKVVFWELNALHYGVPQKRRRLFAIGWRNDLNDLGIKPEYPKPDLEGAENLRLGNIFPDLSFVHPGQFYKNKETGKRVLPHSAEGFAPTLVKSSPPVFIMKDGTQRSATTEEGLKLMSFPKDFKLFTGECTGKNGKKKKFGEKQNWSRIGNAVPPKMMEAVAIQIAALLEEWYKLRK